LTIKLILMHFQLTISPLMTVKLSFIGIHIKAFDKLADHNTQQTSMVVNSKVSE